MRTYATKKHSSTTRPAAKRSTFFKRADGAKLKGTHRTTEETAHVVRSILKRSGGDFSAVPVHQRGDVARYVQQTLGNHARGAKK